MELFRADVNAFVFRLFDEKLLDGSDFSRKSGVFLKYDARKKVWSEFKTFMQSIEPKLDQEIANVRSLL